MEHFNGHAGVRTPQFDGNPTLGGYNLTNGAFFGSIGAAALTGGLLTATIAVK